MTGTDVDIDAITVRYRRDANPLTVLRDVSLRIDAGARVAIMGRSGAGKSTLLALIGGLEAVQEGSIRVGGIDVARLTGDFVDCSQRFCAPFGCGDVGGDGDHLDVAECAQFFSGLVERVLAAGDDDDVGAFAREMFGAGVAEAFTGAADEGDFSLKS